MNLKRGLNNIFYGLVGQIITIALGIILPRMFILSYGSETNGLISSVSQVLSYLSLLEAGVGTATIQALYEPVVDSDIGNINKIMTATDNYYKRTGRIYLFLVTVIAIIYPNIVTSNISKPTISAIILVNSIPSVINYYFQGKYKLLLQAEGKNYIITNLNTIFFVFSSLLKIAFIYLGINIVFVQSIYIVTSLLQMLYFYRYMKKSYKWLDLNVIPDFSAISQKNSVLVHQVAGLILNSTDVTILTIFCGLEAVSIYTMYNMLFSMISTALTTVNESIKFILGQAYTKGREYYLSILDIYETYYIAVIFALNFVAYTFVVPFIKLYTSGSDISYVNYIFPVLFVIIKLIDGGRNVVLTTVVVAGHFSGTQKKAIIECVLNLSISLISVLKFGMVGVLVGTIVALTYRCVDTIIYTNKVILKRSSRYLFGLWIVNLIIFIIMRQIVMHIEFPLATYLEIICSAGILTIVSLIVFVAVTSVFRLRVARQAYTIIKGKILIRRKK